MPRIGINPSRGKKSDYEPARVTMAVLTYLPHQSGYFKNRFDVTRACLESILVNTAMPFDLLVFDNGSHHTLVDYLFGLHRQGKIDFLILSDHNIGKIGALQMISQSAPGEIIAYSDDDVFFLPGWLEKHLEIIDTYPSVGLVTGFYIKSHMDESTSSTMAFAERADVSVKRGDLIDPALTQHYLEQMGRTMEQYQKELEGLEDVKLTYKGVETYASAGHHQFVCFKKTLTDVLPKKWTTHLMGKMRELDASINELGLLRLSTVQPVTRLLGNTIDNKSAEEIRKFGIEISGVETIPSKEKSKALIKSPIVQKCAYYLYERLFRIINIDD